VARAGLLAGLAAFALLAGSAGQTFDQPRRHGPALPGPHVVGPTPPFGGPGPAAPPRTCPRETLVRFSVLESWLRSLPLGVWVAPVAERAMVAQCARAADAGL
jgi:hypothetical protein